MTFFLVINRSLLELAALSPLMKDTDAWSNTGIILDFSYRLESLRRSSTFQRLVIFLFHESQSLIST